MADIDNIKRGVVDIVTEKELICKSSQNRPLRVKLGIDASGPDIHLGFAVVLRKLRQFQERGDIAVLIVGDFTGKIGDPSGVLKTRPQLSDEDIKRNIANYKEQVFKILREDKTEFRYNSEWNAKLTAGELIKLASKATVAQLLVRDDFQKRYKNSNPIALHEFLYPLFQAYDSVAVNADIELGGTDQTFNLLLGRDMQREFRKSPQVCITLPLLEGLDGVRKMSKSYKNYIGITEPPREIYGKIMSIPDSLILRYFRLCTNYSDEEIKKIERALKEGMNPMDMKAKLAYEIVKMYHSEREARIAQEEFNHIFRKGELPEKIPIYQIKDKKIWIVKLLSDSGLTKTRNEARRLIQQGGVKIDNETVKDTNAEIQINKEMVLKVGKRRFLKIIYNS
jgi:tyrosyl-tRNA synthetase